MKSWLERMGQLTAEHREERAARFATLGRRKVTERRMQGFSDTYAKADATWYTARERGQRERPSRVAACGAETLEIQCVGCGKVHERRSGCRIGLLCVPCRGGIAAAKRAAFRRARLVTIADAERRGLLRANRRGGRWSEKFLTLTAPHSHAHSIADRIKHVQGAWKRFLRLLNTSWKEDGVRSAEWFRVFEWTPARDGRGHPHFHLWIFSPFLPRDDVERWWRESLNEQAAYEAQEVIVHIQEVDANGAERELIKYLTKDIDAKGEKLAPELYAEVYKALDAQRSTQASKGFMGKAQKERRECECGCPYPRRVQKRPRSLGPTVDEIGEK